MSGAVRRIICHRFTIAIVIVAALAAGAWASWRWWTGQFLRQGEEALAAHAFGKAKQQLTLYLSYRPGDTRARLLSARAARRLRDFDEAAEQLRRCREDGGPEEEIDVEYALLALQRGDAGPDEALRQRSLQEDELALVILEALIQYDIDTYQLRQAQHD